MYQPVPISTPDEHHRHRDRNHRKLESTSKPDHQPLQPHDDEDYTSDSSQDSNSLSSTSPIIQNRTNANTNINQSRGRRRHHKNFPHTTNPDKSQPAQIPPPTQQYPHNSIEPKPKPKVQATITRRSTPQSKFRHKPTAQTKDTDGDLNKSTIMQKIPDPPIHPAPVLNRTKETPAQPSKYKVTILVCISISVSIP